MLERFYGRGLRPDFSAVAQIHKKAPYAPILKELERLGAHVEDETDTNYDVSFQFVCRFPSKTFNVLLSFVGPYALILGEGGTPAADSIARGGKEVRAIADILGHHGFQITNPKALEQAVALWDEPAGISSLYNALFVTEEAPPWTGRPTSG